MLLLLPVNLHWSRPLQSFFVLLDKFFVIPAGACTLQVGFSFVRSHSSGLFEKSNATIRDVELNPEAGSFWFPQEWQYLSSFCFLFFLGYRPQFLRQVIFSIISCTPKIRLSEDILAKSILKFYTSNNLVPAGIGTSALEDWSEKMSLGAVKVTRKFRRLFLETPTNAKNNVLKELKLRCVNAGISPEESVSSADSQSSRAASHEDLEELAVTPPPAFDWDALAKKVVQLKEKGCSATTVKNTTAQGRPVATPCRSDQQVPAFVLDMMRQKTVAVQPFPTTSGDDDEIAIEKEKPSQAKGASAKGKASKQKPSKSQASKKNKRRSQVLKSKLRSSQLLLQFLCWRLHLSWLTTTKWMKWPMPSKKMLPAVRTSPKNSVLPGKISWLRKGNWGSATDKPTMHGWVAMSALLF